MYLSDLLDSGIFEGSQGLVPLFYNTNKALKYKHVQFGRNTDVNNTTQI